MTFFAINRFAGLVVFATGALLTGVAEAIQYVDSAPAVKLAASYFDTLKVGKFDDAILAFDPNYLSNGNGEWRRLFPGLEQKFGRISSISLTRASIVPINDVGCSLLRYDIGRRLLSTQESLIVCPQKVGGKLSIVGHEVVRKDNGQRIVIGLSVKEVEFKFP